MIRVLQVVTDMSRGGLETLLMNYYRQIDKNLIQFDFLVHRENKCEYDDEIELLGGKIYRFPILNPFSSSYKRALGIFFDEHPEYQIVHVHQDCLSSVILKVAKEHGVKVRIAHSHNSSQNKDIKYPIKLFYRQFIPKYATALLACGKAAGDWMFQGSDYQILNNAIDAKLYTFHEEKRKTIRNIFGISQGENVIGHVGRFSPPKNHSFIIDIFNEVQKKIPAKLILVGEGNFKKDIEDKVRRMGLDKKVIFTGVRSDVADLLQAMDMFLFPSIYEGLPLTIVEAQAAGLPCLISEKVPIECKKTNLVKQLKLSDGAKSWAEAVIRECRIERRNTYEEICKAGFDIKSNADWLTAYYKRAMDERL